MSPRTLATLAGVLSAAAGRHPDDPDLQAAAELVQAETDPTGLQHSRTPDPEPVTVPAGVDLIPITGRGGVLTIPLRPCCGALPGDWCDCDQFAAEVADALAAPLPWGIAS